MIRPSRIQILLMLCLGIPITLLTFFVIAPLSGFGLIAAVLFLLILAAAIRAGLISTISHVFNRIANRPSLAVSVVGVLAFFVAMVLSWCIPPAPFAMDENVYLLAADTFAAGRLTNPPHPLWKSFETFAVLSQPTISSKYPPAQGLFMAMGQRWAGSPVVGVWLSDALACASLCWMLQVWLPLRWAFLGGLVAAVHPGMQGGYFMETGTIKDALFGLINPEREWHNFRCSWSQSYWGGAVAMLGGCLVYGAVPRLLRTCNAGLAGTLGLGLLLLANSRPFEGLVVSLPAALMIFKWLYKQSLAGNFNLIITHFMIPFSMVMLPGLVLMGIYNKAVTGDALKMPYSVYSREFDSAPMFVFMPQPKPKQYSHETIKDIYGWHLKHYLRQQTLGGWLKERKNNILAPMLYFCGPLTFSLFWLPAAVRRKPVAVATACFLFLLSVHQLVLGTMPHYVAPGTGLVMVMIFGCLRTMSVMKYRSQPIGRYLATAMLALVPLALAVVNAKQQTLPRPLHFTREAIQASLEQSPGQHLVMVRESKIQKGFWLDWIRNRADIDSAKVVWARELDPDQNPKVLDYYKGRTVWLLETDNRPLKLKPYKLE